MKEKHNYSAFLIFLDRQLRAIVKICSNHRLIYFKTDHNMNSYHLFVYFFNVFFYFLKQH